MVLLGRGYFGGDLRVFLRPWDFSYSCTGTRSDFLLQQLSLEGTMVVVLHSLAFKCLHAFTSSFSFCGVVITTSREILLSASFALLPP